MIELLPRALFPTRRRGLRWLKEQLRDLGVTAPLSPGCLLEFIENAAKEAAASARSDETYAASLRRQLETRARFIHHWTTSDDKLTQPEWSKWSAIARKHLLPRSWTIPESAATESHRNFSFTVPERLIVKAPRPSHTPPRPLDSAEDLPGTEILSDLKRAGDKS